MIANQAIYIKEKDKAKELTGEELSNYLALERDRLAAVLSGVGREGNAGAGSGGSPDVGRSATGSSADGNVPKDS